MRVSERRGLYYLLPGIMLILVGVGFGIQFAGQCADDYACIVAESMTSAQIAADMDHLLDMKLAVLTLVCCAGWMLAALGVTRLFGDARKCKIAVAIGLVMLAVIVVVAVAACFDIPWARTALLYMGCPLPGRLMWLLYFFPMATGLVLGFGLPSE